MDTQEDRNIAAAKLDEVAEMMRHFARVLRGEAEDHTGRGAWRILCGHLEKTMHCKIISAEQYQAFIEFSEADFRRRGGVTSY